jgi:hypothetical protein
MPPDHGGAVVINIFHYTDRDGWIAIRAQKVWRFKTSQPKDPDRPAGVYFTEIPPTPENLRTLHKRIRVPVAKQEYVFWFVGADGLRRLNDGRGRDRYIYFSAVDYEVSEDRQRHGDRTELVPEGIS